MEPVVTAVAEDEVVARARRRLTAHDRLGYAIVSVVAVLVAVGIGYQEYEDRRLEADGVPGTARVLAIDRGRWTDEVFLTYDARGRTHFVTIDVRDAPFEEDDRIPIEFDPSTPGRARTLVGWQHRWVESSVLVLGLVALLVTGRVAVLRRRARVLEQLRTGPRTAVWVRSIDRRGLILKDNVDRRFGVFLDEPNRTTQPALVVPVDTSIPDGRTLLVEARGALQPDAWIAFCAPGELALPTGPAGPSAISWFRRNRGTLLWIAFGALSVLVRAVV